MSGFRYSVRSTTLQWPARTAKIVTHFGHYDRTYCACSMPSGDSSNCLCKINVTSPFKMSTVANCALKVNCNWGILLQRDNYVILVFTAYDVTINFPIFPQSRRFHPPLDAPRSLPHVAIPMSSVFLFRSTVKSDCNRYKVHAWPLHMWTKMTVSRALSPTSFDCLLVGPFLKQYNCNYKRRLVFHILLDFGVAPR